MMNDEMRDNNLKVLSIYIYYELACLTTVI